MPNLLKRIPLPRVILLDLMMPVMNGWQFVDTLRKIRDPPPIPIVVLTAFHDRTRSIAVEKVLERPADLELLISTVHQLAA